MCSNSCLQSLFQGKILSSSDLTQTLNVGQVSKNGVKEIDLDKYT